MMKKDTNLFTKIVSAESIFNAWWLFKRGKGKRKDVKEFECHLEKNIFNLHRELLSKTYQHSEYSSFFIQDPKVRHIRKACVKDRLVHQIIYTALTEIFEPKFIHHLYSSRLGKGTHKGIEAQKTMLLKVSKNNHRPCWALKCDIKKFYNSVDHKILLSLIARTVKDNNLNWLITEVVQSFHFEGTQGKGLPIGNLTSQVFTNIYLNEFDQFIKHKLHQKYYLRFADDFLTLSPNKSELEALLPLMQKFLADNLELTLHPKKLILKPFSQGIDFLGYVTLPNHRVLRTKTKQRMKRKLSKRIREYFSGEIDNYSMNQSLQSYLGVLSHANAYKLQQEIRNQYFINY